mgnify:CR=1 FL=1
MYPGILKTSLNLPKVINGVSKTLSVANQLIPLYVKAKPLINNAKSAFSVAKEILSTPNSNSSNNSKVPSKVNQPKEKRSVNTITPPTKNSNNPVFFL